MKDSRFKKWYLIVTITLTAGFSIWIIWYTWGANNRNGLIHAQYFEENDSPRLLLFHANTPYSEDNGYYLDGYEVKLVNPQKNEEINSVYIDRYVASPPPWPTIKYYGFENIWIIQPNQFVQGDTGYVKKIKLVNSQLIVEDSPLLRGLSPAQAWGKHWFILKNKYNEMSCLDLRYNQVTPGQCTTTEPTYDTITCAYITAPKEPGSIRSRIYFYETDKPDPMQISMGSAEPPSLLYSLWFSQNNMDEPQLAEYAKRFKPNEKMILIPTTDYLISPLCIYKSRDKVVYLENDRDNKRIRFHCFGRNGEIFWKIDDDRLQFENQQQPPTIKCTAYKNKFILSSINWVIAIDNTTGKLVWYYKV